jgi:hypothetical protein
MGGHNLLINETGLLAYQLAMDLMVGHLMNPAFALGSPPEGTNARMWNPPTYYSPVERFRNQKDPGQQALCLRVCSA